MTAREDAAKRRGGWAAKKPPTLEEPATDIVLSVSIRGQFEASVRIPLSEAKDFDSHVSRWLDLMHTALRTNVEAMDATIAKLPPPDARASP